MPGTHTHKSGGASRLTALRRAGSQVFDNPAPKRRSLIETIRADSMELEKAPASTPAQHSAPLDIERIAMRLDGFEMYAFLASLIAGFSFGCLDEYNTMPSLGERFPLVVSYPISLAFSISLVASPGKGATPFFFAGGMVSVRRGS